METIKQLFSRFSVFWRSLKLWQRASIIGAIVGVLALLVFAVIWAGRTSYEPLFSGLEVNDQASIVAYLKENGIQHELNPVANAVLVPADQVHDIKLSLAQVGLPRGSSKGFEIFDDPKMGSSEFDKQVAYVRAVEGELERTIANMNVVDSAKVRIVVPKPQLFLETREPSQAAVLIQLKPGMRIMPNQVKAIVFLVSRSVEGLMPEGVTVVDGSGRVLSDMITDDWLLYPDGENTVTSLQRQIERQHENEFANKVRFLLERVFGVGNVLAEVRVEMDFNKKDSSLKEFLPYSDTGAGITRSRETQEETYNGEGAYNPGAPGTTTNIPGYNVNNGQNVTSEYNQSRTTNNMEISTRQTNETATPGAIKRLTASVIVNKEPNEDELAQIREITTNAIGLDPTRGDQIAVSAMKFDDTLARELMDELRRERMTRLVIGSLLAVAALLCIAFAAVWWIRRRRARMALDAMQKENKHVPTIQEMLTSPDLLAFQGEMAVLEEQLKAYAKNNPSEVANLVNEWISSDS